MTLGELRNILKCEIVVVYFMHGTNKSDDDSFQGEPKDIPHKFDSKEVVGLDVFYDALNIQLKK